MPLTSIEAISDPSTLQTRPEQYLIFCSSIVDGQMWCPDCRTVESKLKQAFDKPDGPDALVVYVGNKPEWKSPSNIFRGDPWQVRGVPTIIKKDGTQEVSRLEDDTAIMEKLTHFIAN